jgi:Ca-activated chloride channel homolog
MRKLIVGTLISFLISGCAGAGGAVAPSDAGSKKAPPANAAVDPAKPLAIAENGGSDDALPVSSRAWLGAAASSAFLPAGINEHTLAVWVDVPDTSDRARVPVAVALTVDTSGSMGSHNKIAHARSAARRVVDGLQDGDIVALHTFSDDVKVRVPQTVLGPETRRAISNVIEELEPHGGTNLFDGVRMAQASAAASDEAHPVRRVIVISDGKATVGPTMPDVIGQLGEAGTAQGVQVTSFGVGLDYDETALNALAVRSSGRLYHIAEAAELSGIVDRELALVQKTMATQAFVEIVPAPGVTLIAAEGVRTSWGANRALRVPLGSMFGGQVRELVVRVRVDEAKAGERPILSARLHYRDPSDGGLERVQEVVARANFTNDATQVAAHGHPRAQSIISVQRAALLASEASAQANAGDFGNAERQLALAEAELRRGAERAKTKNERARIMSSVDRMGSARRSMKAASAAPAAKRATIGRANALDLNDAAMDMKGY